MHFLTVLGARPQFVKAAPLSSALRAHGTETIVHTGQHYDAGMSDVFFAELGIASPDHHLGIGSGSQGAQTGAMLASLEQVMLAERPDVVVVLGDTNSTLAGALAAAKLHLPVAHVEAGLRSFNRRMPEEVNRVMTDHLSQWSFAPSDGARRQLADEGITHGVHVVGDIMLDVVLQQRERARTQSRMPAALDLVARGYALATIHRAENTDDRHRLSAVLDSIGALELPVVLPLHPRTRSRIEGFGLSLPSHVRVVEPMGYLDMLALLDGARCVITDSGGVQKEAYYVGVPCVTLRDETEWTETVAAGWNMLCQATPDALTAAVAHMTTPRPTQRPLYGDGTAAEQIAVILAAA
jgi:UDP-N-acetylglucosamine 2-epimerase